MNIIGLFWELRMLKNIIVNFKSIIGSGLLCCFMCGIVVDVCVVVPMCVYMCVCVCECV